MAVTISGSDGISGDLPTIKVGNGSESAPAVTGQDTDTGLFFGTNEIKVSTGGTEAITVDSSQQVGVGTSSPDALLEVRDTASTGIISRSGSTQATDTNKALKVRNNSDTDTFSVSYRGEVYCNGNFFVGTTDQSLFNNNSSTGGGLSFIGEFGVARWQNNVGYFNRMGNDGTILTFQGQGTTEGNIRVSGSTVSLTGSHLSRWSQLAGGAERTEILRGSVLSNLDEMCEWGEEDNEQLNRMKVSDVEGDVNVAGVFESWDDDDDTYTNDFYCAMTGDFVIRIAQGVTVARGDLLMSAGDGTAKPQGDDIIRSKTIAKVTSTVVSETYADGSYCVPCVLMAC